MAQKSFGDRHPRLQGAGRGAKWGAKRSVKTAPVYGAGAAAYGAYVTKSPKGAAIVGAAGAGGSMVGGTIGGAIGGAIKPQNFQPHHAPFHQTKNALGAHQF